MLLRGGAWMLLHCRRRGRCNRPRWSPEQQAMDGTARTRQCRPAYMDTVHCDLPGLAPHARHMPMHARH